ncbi:hypothetical protein VTO42DRAFT_1053 [Malbranchea cinnamomea]
MESSPVQQSVQPGAVAGAKRGTTLLPPFDPSSSPPLPRPLKRLARDSCEREFPTYPTPVPTSSTALLTSSPPRVPTSRRPHFPRTQSMLSERAPLSAVPCIMLQETGEPVTMGRSSASCDYQLSSNRLISRVHVKAMYKPAQHPFDRDRIEILCLGWNGIRLHCQGKAYELTKGKTFTSDIKDADVMIDVQDVRVLIQWPRQEKKDTASTHSDQTWEESSPVRNPQPSVYRHSVSVSPVRNNRPRLVSPISPSPAAQSLAPAAPATPTHSAPGAVVVYEDEPSPAHKEPAASASATHSTQLASNPVDDNSRNILSNSLGAKSDELSEHDEENDPIIHSFGPFGDNLLPRMASFHAGESPSRSRQEKAQKLAQPPSQIIPRKRSLEDPRRDTLQNHVINQLAFSRLSSTPFSNIVNNLPIDLVQKNSNPNGFSHNEIRAIIRETKCVGEVTRQGKDAAGKPLESEYYYIPELDTDEHRREAVVNGLGKRGLRNCRKQHKQYYWRKPRTP